MKITATQIAEWAKTGEAQRELPRLIRKLIHTIGSVTQVSIPAGESTSQPGFDGELFSEDGNAWVPQGHSVWEMSCRNDVTAKANKDYDKRVTELSAAQRAERVYISVTARKWSRKTAWREKKSTANNWAAVRAYDADDLEQWLEQSPGIALEFGETLGLIGDGVESLSRFWQQWSTQTNPTISRDALLAGRADHATSFVERIKKLIKEAACERLSLNADSVEEATAFAAACLMDNLDLATGVAIVTSPAGWRFVDMNSQIRIAIAARPEIAERPSSHDGLLVILPYASGDMTGHFRGVASRAGKADFQLELPEHGDFEKALLGLGVDANDARRLSSNCGRSWTVFRRQHAQNPAIRRPAWLEQPSAAVLSTLCLIGGWSSESAADKGFVERLAGKPYADLQRNLADLERLDDSPVIRIGGVWKAKSALELLALFGDRITDAELDSFFSIAEEVLSAPDPRLELPDNERYAAAIHGKVRPYSGFLIESLCDTLIKLAVRGPDIQGLQVRRIEQRVSGLVRRLLDDADATRWLSLSGILPQLAEAAPDTFLLVVESSLSKLNAPVRALLEETQESGMFGRCWHAGLLWALETLAWAPERLLRVSLILARLSETEIKGNWANSPQNSLVDLFRTWFPQTAATVDKRIAVLDELIRRVPEAAYALLDRLAHVGHDTASHTHRPKWRDDDAGAGQGATGQERNQMLVAAADRQISMAEGRADRVVKLISKLSDFDEPRIARVFELIKPFTASDASDADKMQLRDALRKCIYWHRNYDDVQGEELDRKLSYHETAYKALEPQDLISRHGWLFADGWPDLPVRTREENYADRQELFVEWRIQALHEVYTAEGWPGISRMATQFSAGWQIGVTLPRLGINADEVAHWIVNQAGHLESGHEQTFLAEGILWALPKNEMVSLVQRVVTQAAEFGWENEKTIRFLTLAPEGEAIWKLAADLGKDSDQKYWQTIRGNLRLRDNEGEFNLALERFLVANRPRTAFAMCRLDFKKTGADLLTQIVEGIVRGEEPNGPILDSHYFQKALERIENSQEIESDRLIRLEFGLIPLLGYKVT